MGKIKEQTLTFVAEFLYSGAAGRNKIDVASTAFTHDSFSLIASMTKVVTSACVLQLVDKGVLDLDEDVRPKFPYMQTLQVIRGFKDDGEAILEENTEPISLRYVYKSHPSYKQYFLR